MSAPPEVRRLQILRYPVDDLTVQGALDAVRGFVENRGTHRIAAINAAKVVKMESDPALARAVTGCELIIADGMSIVWATFFLTGRRIHRVAGIDLMEALVAQAARLGHSVYLLGAKEEINARCAEVLRARNPGLRVAGRHHGYLTPEIEAQVLDEIRRTTPDLVFIGMSTPAKELWIDRHHRALGVPVVMGVGGSFDVVAGLVRRAPRWVQASGFEWLFRLLQEPRRLWKRYLTTGVVFVGKVFAGRLRRGR